MTSRRVARLDPTPSRTMHAATTSSVGVGLSSRTPSARALAPRRVAAATTTTKTTTTTTTTIALFGAKKTSTTKTSPANKKTSPPKKKTPSSSSVKNAGVNLINPKPLYAKGEEPWYIDKETGKAPGYLQVAVFMASQLFVGVVMQPFALWYDQLFSPFLRNGQTLPTDFIN